jgi:hypothetical protein
MAIPKELPPDIVSITQPKDIYNRITLVNDKLYNVRLNDEIEIKDELN